MGDLGHTEPEEVWSPKLQAVNLRNSILFLYSLFPAGGKGKWKVGSISNHQVFAPDLLVYVLAFRAAEV